MKNVINGYLVEHYLEKKELVSQWGSVDVHIHYFFTYTKNGFKNSFKSVFVLGELESLSPVLRLKSIEQDENTNEETLTDEAIETLIVDEFIHI